MKLHCLKKKPMLIRCLESVSNLRFFWYGCWTKNRGFYHPKSSNLFIGFSIIFTIHFGIPLFLETPIWLLDYGKCSVLKTCGSLWKQRLLKIVFQRVLFNIFTGVSIISHSRVSREYQHIEVWIVNFEWCGKTKIVQCRGWEYHDTISPLPWGNDTSWNDHLRSDQNSGWRIIRSHEFRIPSQMSMPQDLIQEGLNSFSIDVMGERRFLLRAKLPMDGKVFLRTRMRYVQKFLFCLG